eukprot:53013-Chlamydomonas_euryale.AAC.2
MDQGQPLRWLVIVGLLVGRSCCCRCCCWRRRCAASLPPSPLMMLVCAAAAAPVRVARCGAVPEFVPVAKAVSHLS